MATFAAGHSITAQTLRLTPVVVGLIIVPPLSSAVSGSV